MVACCDVLLLLPFILLYLQCRSPGVPLYLHSDTEVDLREGENTTRCSALVDSFSVVSFSPYTFDGCHAPSWPLIVDIEYYYKTYFSTWWLYYVVLNWIKFCSLVSLRTLGTMFVKPADPAWWPDLKRPILEIVQNQRAYALEYLAWLTIATI